MKKFYNLVFIIFTLFIMILLITNIKAFAAPEKVPKWTKDVSPETVNAVGISNEGKYIMVATSENYLTLYGNNTSIPLNSVHLSYSPTKIVMNYSGDFAIISSGNILSYIAIQENSMDEEWSFTNNPGYSGGIYSLALSDDGKYLAVGTWGYSGYYYYSTQRSYTYAYLFDVSTGTMLWKKTIGDIYSKYTYDYVSVDISSDGQYIVAGSTYTKKVYLFTKDGTEKYSYTNGKIFIYHWWICKFCLYIWRW